jgi:stage II sporulation protein AA (anti-sigma F factor antagonist)
MFEVERDGDTLIVVPAVDLGEVEYQRIEAGAAGILASLNDPGIKNLVMDFYKTDYYGSTALGFFVKLWKRVSRRGGRMAFCNVSKHEREILRVTKLDHSWPIHSSRAEALQAVKWG